MMRLTLKEKKEEAENIWSFVFSKPENLTFQAGQFLQLFVPHKNPDERGIKRYFRTPPSGGARKVDRPPPRAGGGRYFTVAASPSEDFLMITTKIVADLSTFKKALLNSSIGVTFEAMEPAGTFLLPEKITPCVLIAGGIGVTPYRSMAKFAADKNLKIPLKVIYANKTPQETAYLSLFQNLGKQNGNFRVFYTMTDLEKIKTRWIGRVGRVDESLIKEVVGELDSNLYYVSGPEPMVDAYKDLLLGMGIAEDLIRLDFFPGYKNEKL